MKHNRSILIVLLILIAALLTACGGEDEGPTAFKIGVISGVDSFNATIDGFQTAMSDQGYVETEDIIYDVQAAGGDRDKMREIADQFVADEVDLIFTTTTGAVLAAKAATEGTDIPVIFTIVLDPIASGVVADLTQPGGNVTGVARANPAHVGARLQYMQDMAPDIETVWILYMPDYPTAGSTVPVVQESAADLGLELIETEVDSGDALLAELESRAAAEGLDVDAILIMPDTANGNSAQAILEFGLAHNVPVAANSHGQANMGCLFAYSDDNYETGQMAARMVDRILKGADPADLPVENAEAFLTVNMGTADAIGLEIPSRTLRMAREIIHIE